MKPPSKLLCIYQAYTHTLSLSLPPPFLSTPLQPLSLFLCPRLIHGKPLTRFTRRQERVNAFLLAQAAPQTAKISVERSLREIGYPRSRFRRHAFKVETHGNGKQMHSACAGSCGELPLVPLYFFFCRLTPPPLPLPPLLLPLILVLCFGSTFLPDSSSIFNSVFSLRLFVS